mmetsp:Transcript_20227/g.65651  ORF Transcript_20227/g.65651 Transcript_20227/m.65651 type:complete len:217 (+) Transcript_20227:472-1122(+)
MDISLPACGVASHHGLHLRATSVDAGGRGQIGRGRGGGGAVDSGGADAERGGDHDSVQDRHGGGGAAARDGVPETGARLPALPPLLLFRAGRTLCWVQLPFAQARDLPLPRPGNAGPTDPFRGRGPKCPCAATADPLARSAPQARNSRHGLHRRLPRPRRAVRSVSRLQQDPSHASLCGAYAGASCSGLPLHAVGVQLGRIPARLYEDLPRRAPRL